MSNVFLLSMKGGEIIRLARKRRGYTQAELAHQYGIDEQTLRNYEKLKTSISYDDVLGILDFLDINAEDLKDAA